jgi:hypothetical protein
MKFRSLKSFCIVFAMVAWCVQAQAQTTRSATSKVVESATAFLSTLDAKERASVLYKFDDNKQRARWSNFPTGFVPRGGISLKQMNDAQRTAAMNLVAAALSQRGFEKVQQIMQGDEVLKSLPDNGPGGGGPGGPRGGRPDGGRPDDGPHDGGPPDGGPRGGPPFGNGGSMFGKDLYYISILGTPSEKDPWMLQFGGHHLALNITIAGEHGVLTPTLTGAQPALYTLK